MERSHSGLVRLFGEQIYSQEYRGFESLPLRHPSPRLRTGYAILRQGYGLATPSFAKATDWLRHMYYVYILKSSKTDRFYTGWTTDLKKRFKEHNSGLSKATKPYIPWRIVFYASFETEKLAKDFELYLKTGSGRSFAYKRLLE